MQRTRLAYMWCCIRYRRFGVSYQTGIRVMLFEKIINCCLHFEELNGCGKTGNVAVFFSVWIKILPEKDISGRIKTNCNTQFGCCHNGGRLALRCGFSAPWEGTFLEYEKIPQSNTERGMIDMSDFELLSLVVMTANLIVQILIYIKKKWAALCPKVYDSFFLSIIEG